MKKNSLLILSFLLLNLINSVFTLQDGEADFNGVNPEKCFKDLKNHNPWMTRKFTADPGVMEYDRRFHLYGTNDEYLQGNALAKIQNGNFKSLNVMSSADLVN